jgi:glycosyltransferase involved in cell wall biosynthesis
LSSGTRAEPDATTSVGQISKERLQRRRLVRVVLVTGSFPEDTGYIARLADAVDLTVYGTTFRRPIDFWNPSPPSECRTRTFEPVIQTGRGHQLWVYKGMSSAFDKDMPDIVHVISEPWGALSVQASNWTRKHSSSKLVIHACDRIWWHGVAPEIAAKKMLARLALARAGAFAGMSDVPVDLARSSGLAPDVPSAVIHSHPRDGDLFVPPRDAAERAAARRQLGLPVEGTGIGFLGRLDYDKGPLAFTGAMAKLDLDAMGVWAAIGGAGTLEDAVASGTATGNYAFLGSLRFPDQVTAFYKAVDVFVAPSIRTHDMEDQSPRSIIEGMLSGCVVVGSDCGAIPDMIDGVGVVTQQNNVDDLSSGVAGAVVLSSDASFRRAARHRALEHYSSESTATGLLALWDEALGLRRTARRTVAPAPERPAALRPHAAGKRPPV